MLPKLTRGNARQHKQEQVSESLRGPRRGSEGQGVRPNKCCWCANATISVRMAKRHCKTCEGCQRRGKQSIVGDQGFQEVLQGSRSRGLFTPKFL